MEDEEFFLLLDLYGIQLQSKTENDHGTAGQTVVLEMYMFGKPCLQKSFKSSMKSDNCLLHDSSAKIGGVTEQIHFDALKLGKHCINSIKFSDEKLPQNASIFLVYGKRSEASFVTECLTYITELK